MKALLLSFSGRKTMGNCLGTLDHISDILDEEGVDSHLIEMNDHNIAPCSECKYQCFDPDKDCPKSDDISDIYGEIVDHDLVFISVPIYSGAPCSKYFAFRERSQSVFHDVRLYNRFERVSKYYIVIGNEESGGKETVDLLSSDLKKHEEIILLQSHNYSQSSISGRIIENDGAKELLDSFVKDALKKHENIARKYKMMDDAQQKI